MKKLFFLVISGMLLIGVSVYAQGNLLVEGDLGIGLGGGTPQTKLDISTDTDALNVVINQTTDPSVIGADYEINIDGATDLGNSSGFRGIVKHIGTSKVPATRGGQLTYQFRSPTPGSSNFSFIYGLDLAIRDMSVNARNYTGNTIAMFRAGGAYEGTGTINVTDLIGAWLVNPVNSGALSATNAYGMLIQQQTSGTSNYGIALTGDGAGSDVVFGPNKDARIYSNTGELFVQDSGSNVTQISPHDPVTGEWRFYSKNIKTGKVLEVNMEKLVRAVEKLTGEKFMIETFESVD